MEKMPELPSQRRFAFDWQAFLIVTALGYLVARYGLSWSLNVSRVFALSSALALAIEDRRPRSY
jgi:hypothetical protein